MSELLAAVCSVAPTRRRRFLWAAWWSGPPEREPFRRPDASSGGARTREEALREAERAAGRALVEVDGRWARAWARVLCGEPPWPPASAPAATRADGARSAAAAPESAWQILGVARDATAEELKRAFRRRALETHPDRGGDAAAFRRVKAAYERALATSGRPPRPRARARRRRG
ncbi:MAG: J domain-containing protein [Polyangiaceae bacterium]|nr:J domain-containing protein [Polyangiaceae bacterium]